MNCRVSRDKAQLASAPHWAVVEELLKRPRRDELSVAREVVAKTQATFEPLQVPVLETPSDSKHESEVRRIAGAKEPAVVATLKSPAVHAPVAEKTQEAPVIHDTTMPPLPSAMPMSHEPMRMQPAPAASVGDDVLEMPGDATDSASILATILRRSEWGLVECPVTPPMCPAARLAVSRERGLVLIAAATRGLSELRAIGSAYRWMTENRSLIAMAMPQFAIDANQTPGLQMLVDQSDISAELLRPMMQSGHVTVHAYRTLRWAGRRGLLLEAA
jgi:hypothetical protein